MRRALAALTLVACTSTEPPPPPAAAPPPAPPARQELALPGILVSTPADWQPFEPERTETLRASALAQYPGATVDIVGRTHPSGFGRGAAYIQRSLSPRDPTHEPLTVRQTLERTRDLLTTQLTASGLELLRSDFAERDGGLEGCLDARMGREGRTITMSVCTRLTVKDRDHLVFLVATCLDHDVQCDDILATRRHPPEPILPLDELLPPNADPPAPIAALRRDGLAGVAFGSTPAQFRAACRKARLRPDDYDWEREPAALRAMVDAGRIAACSGLPPGDGPAFDLGRATHVQAQFDDGKLASLNVQIDADPVAVADRLTALYPRGVEELGRRIHIVDEHAGLDELVSIGVGPPSFPEARLSLTFVSRRNLDGPPPAP